MTLGACSERRLRDLYEISTLLTRFEGLERTLTEVSRVMAHALPISTAVFVLEEHQALRSHVWKAPEIGDRQSAAAVHRAREAYRWFTGSSAKQAHSDVPAADPLPLIAGDHRPVLLPLVVERGRVFGVLQVEGALSFGEADLWLLNAAANQIAIAIDRQTVIDGTEQRVRAQLDFTRTLTASLGEGILAADVDGRITFLNPAAEVLLGWPETSVLGTRVADVLRVRGADGIMLPAEGSPLARALETEGRVASDDHAFLGREGAGIPVSYTASPIRSGGKLQGAVVVFRDVLAVKRAERAQRLLSDTSAALADSLDHRSTLEAFVHCTVPAFADVCSYDEAKPGDKEAQTPTTGRARLVESPADAAGVARTFIVVPLGIRGRRLGVLTFGMGDSGRRLTADDLPVAEDLGHRAAAAFEQARLHHAALDAIRDRQDVLAIVAHDLRSPLSIVSMAIADLLERCADSDAQACTRALLEMIERAAERMERMTSDLLDVASIEAGRLSVDLRPTKVSSIVEDVFEAMARSAAEKNVTLVAAASTPEAVVLCDRGRVLQVLVNIVGNAVKFTPAGGRIELSVREVDGRVRFAVADSGPGIATALVPHVFERYRQASSTASKGRGLGLFIARGIVEAHGGTIGVDTASQGGTTISFALPAAVAS